MSMEDTPTLRSGRLRRLLSHVETLPRTTRSWSPDGGRLHPETWDQCSYRTCLAGHAIRLWGPSELSRLLDDNESVYDSDNVHEVARAHLGLTQVEADALFGEAGNDDARDYVERIVNGEYH
jgi:hypothetical protein